MNISEIKDKEIWENFLQKRKEKTFLQSWNWGEFQEKMGNKIWRLGIFDEDNLVGVALTAKIKAKRGTFLLIQHGPVIGLENQKKEIFQVFLEELKKIGKKEQASFIRINPLWEGNQGDKDILKSFGFREAPMHASAYETTWKLDITIPEEEILKNMRKTTRYLIRQSSKNRDITVEKSESPVDVAMYQKLNEEVAKRQRFVPFSFEFIKNEFEVFSKTEPRNNGAKVEKRNLSSSPDGQALLLFGKYKDEIAAVALVIFWSGICFYHQAASSLKYAKFSIPYLLCWEAIKEAKERQCSFFDFWGYVDPKENPRHPWAGPTLFKMGFGGDVYFYVKTQDLPLSKKYWLTYLFEKVRKTKRGL